MLQFIDNIEPWQYAVGALVILVLSASIGDFDLLPWISASIVLLAILDYFKLGPLVQLSAFPLSFTAFLYISKRLLRGSAETKLIAVDVYQMIDQHVRITKISFDDSTRGEATSTTGQTWNVRHIHGNEITKDAFYCCIEVEGICLLIK